MDDGKLPPTILYFTETLSEILALHWGENRLVSGKSWNYTLQGRLKVRWYTKARGIR